MGAAVAAAAPRSDNFERLDSSLPVNEPNAPETYTDHLKRAYGQMAMYPIVAATAFEDTTPGQRLYVTLPESQPLHVPYTAQHRFGPVLR